MEDTIVPATRNPTDINNVERIRKTTNAAVIT
jgi:hypothetical protein